MKKITIQSKGHIEHQRINLDKNSKHNLELCHHLIGELLNIKVSTSTLLRMAVYNYRLTFAKAAHDAFTKGRNHDEQMKLMADWCENERNLIEAVAKG